MQIKNLFYTIVAAGLFLPFASSAYAITPELQEIYNKRGDLQAVFQGETFQAVPETGAGFLIDLEDWARQYGWKDYAELKDYAPKIAPPVAKADTSAFPEILSQHYIILDNASGEILAADGADISWPIASITKLTTVKTALENGLDPYSYGDVLSVDNVGGARLKVESGTRFFVKDLLYATLVGSVNNGANAIARLTGLKTDTFVDKMNNYAKSLNLGRTHFVDPTGIEVENTSTAREIAALARDIFQQETIRKMAGTSGIHIESVNNDYIRDISSTNRLLYDPRFDDVYVTAGKTGYLYESEWNLLVRMHPMNGDPSESVLIVIFGAPSRDQSFLDAYALAHWSWDSFDWE